MGFLLFEVSKTVIFIESKSSMVVARVWGKEKINLLIRGGIKFRLRKISKF